MRPTAVKFKNGIEVEGSQMDPDAVNQVIDEERVFQGNYLEVERLRFMLPDGTHGERERVRGRDAVAVLPVEKSGDVHLVRQYRHAIGQTIVEVPAGLLDDGEDDLQAALRECEEETGYRPGKMTRLLRYAHAEGYSTGFITLFLGTELAHTGKICLDTTEYLEHVTLPFEELRNLVKTNQIIDSKTILCTFLGESLITP